MQLVLWVSLILQLVESNDVTILLVGSRHKLTQNRVIEKRKKVLEECERNEMSCSVVDALNDSSSESQGFWAITPAIFTLTNVSDWTIIAEDTSEINIENLKRFISTEIATDTVFAGFGLRDKEPTIIHHFGMNAPTGFHYPLLSVGFVLSRTVVDSIRTVDQMENGFSIDVKYEFAMLLYKKINVQLRHQPSRFCCGNDFNTCIIRCSSPTISSFSLQDSEVHLMVKTFEGHHKNRLDVLKNTWTSDVKRVEYCSDKEDRTIPTVDLGIGNTERGHCAKTWAIFRRFLEVSGVGAKWLVIADDDTLMNWKRLKQMLEMYDPDDKILIGERYGFGFNIDGLSGYDYPTGGSGMIFSRSAIQSILKVCPSCAADTDPDDMTIGICAISSGIPIVHESRLHQARPQDYAPEYLKNPISFHKFTDIDPIAVYYKYLFDIEDHAQQNHDSDKTEL
ncbi:Protein CBG09318 [Caenorhabditis briggsae]|uniref:N-acetylgalactosaminide beta-1,3-galactosyltransferase n=2 Tax=Caenorhabditis briggsae TaxID=6238 RepID=A8X9D7_CAEBR|nr:Protein CBG09318 [Caenorhabditis briggsae]ULT90060.1 hypothetical protein L3Y34_008442 [Caenorhabditis briggsae]CAP29249.2 Protein CBG09318 [Caenorhabditis briggsae]